MKSSEENHRFSCEIDLGFKVWSTHPSKNIGEYFLYILCCKCKQCGRFAGNILNEKSGARVITAWEAGRDTKVFWPHMHEARTLCNKDFSYGASHLQNKNRKNYCFAVRPALLMKDLSSFSKESGSYSATFDIFILTFPY